MDKIKSKKLGLSNFPEDIDEKNNLKFYGELSYENQLALLSHYIHNSEEVKKEIKQGIKSF